MQPTGQSGPQLAERVNFGFFSVNVTRPTGELFGFDRLHQSAAYWSQQGDSAEDVARGIWADLTAWAGDEPHHDDMTLLVMRVPNG